MPLYTPPDMRVFDRTVANDHAIYDAALAKTFEHCSKWTRSTIGTVPLTIDHFRHDTLTRLQLFLGQVPDEGLSKGIAKQDLSDRRILQQHLANQFVLLWGRGVHVCGQDEQEVLQVMRKNLNDLIVRKLLFLDDLDSPLHRNHRAKSTRYSDEGSLPAIKMKDDDVALAKFIAGPNSHILGNPAINQHTLDILRQVQPFLATVDSTHITSPLLELRQRIREMLSRRTVITSDFRFKVLKVIADDWIEVHSEEEQLEALAAIEEEFKEAGIDSLLDRSPEFILKTCFEDDLAADEIDEATRKRLLRRQPILEYFVFETIRKEDTKLGFEHVIPIFQKYFAKVSPRHEESGHLGISYLICEEKFEAQIVRNQLLV